METGSTRHRGLKGGMERRIPRHQACRLFLCCHPWHGVSISKLTHGPRWLHELQPSGPYSKQEVGGREEGSLLRSLRNPRNLIQQFCFISLAGS